MYIHFKSGRVVINFLSSANKLSNELPFVTGLPAAKYVCVAIENSENTVYYLQTKYVHSPWMKFQYVFGMQV